MSVKRNIVANYLGQGWTALMGLAFIPVYIKYLGIEAYGLIGVFALMQTWLALLDMGMTPALTREFARFKGGAIDVQTARDLLRSIEIIGLGLAAAISLAIWGSSTWLVSNWLRVVDMPVDVAARAVSVMGVVTALRVLENVYRSSIVGMQAQVTLNVATGVLATARGLGAVGVLIYVSSTIEAFFVWQCLVSIMTTAALAVIVYRILPSATRHARFSPAALAQVWRFAVATFGLTALGFLLSQADKVVLSKLLSLKEFGYYSLAFAIAGAIRLLAQPVDQGIYPKLTELLAGADQARLVRTYHKAAQLTVVLMGSAAAFLATFSDEVLLLWTDDRELTAQSHLLLSLLVVGMLLNGLLNGPYYLQMAAGWTALMLRVNAVAALVFLPIVYVLTQRFGALGAALAWLGLNLSYLAVVVPLMHRRLLPAEMWKWFGADVSLPLLAGASASLALRWIMPADMGGLLLLSFFAVALLAAFAASALAAADVRRELCARLTGRLARQAI